MTGNGILHVHKNLHCTNTSSESICKIRGKDLSLEAYRWKKKERKLEKNTNKKLKQ